VTAPQSFLVTLKNWFELILNYFIERWTNAFAEGVNNKIKLTKRRAFRFTNFDHFRLRSSSSVLPTPLNPKGPFFLKTQYRSRFYGIETGHL
jgi:hypothetical protein